MPASCGHAFALGRRLAALGFVAALTLGGCGSDGGGITIPDSSSDQMLEALDRVESACTQGRGAAVNAARQFVQEVNLLPADVGAEAKDALRGAGENLEELASEQCKPSRPVPEPTTSSSSTPEPTSSTTSSTSTATTTTTTSTSTTTTSSTETETDTDTDSSTTTQSSGGGAEGSGGIGGGKVR